MFIGTTQLHHMSSVKQKVWSKKQTTAKLLLLICCSRLELAMSILSRFLTYHDLLAQCVIYQAMYGHMMH